MPTETAEQDIGVSQPKTKTPSTAKTVRSSGAADVTATSGGLRKKLIEVAKGLPTLNKGEENPEGWKYPSIDSYYQFIGKKLSAAGILWTMRERGYVLTDGIISATYAFDVYSEDEILRDFSILTVFHDYEGSTTCGKLISYADKVFLRQLVKAVTGEIDSDATAKTPDKKPKFKTAAPGQVVRVPPDTKIADLKTTAVVDILAAIDAKETYDDLIALWDKLANQINELEDVEYKVVKKAFGTKKEELQ